MCVRPPLALTQRGIFRFYFLFFLLSTVKSVEDGIVGTGNAAELRCLIHSTEKSE
jgi:hypothetical protein